MKKFSATLGMLAFCSLMMNGQAVTNQTTGNEYDNLKSAWDAVENGQTLILNEDVEVSSRLGGNGRQFTLDGNGHKINRSTSLDKKSLMFLTNKSTGNVTVKNVTIDGGGNEITGSIIESSGNSTLNLENVTFTNVNTTNGQGIICTKGGGKLNATNVTVSNSTLIDGAGAIYVGNTANVSLGGTCTLSVCLQGTMAVNCTDLTAGKVTVYFETGRDVTKPVVNGATDSSLFEIGNSAYMFELTDGNLTVKEKANDPSKAIFNLNSQEGYTDLLEAWNAANSGDVIFLNQNATISDRLEGKGRILTLKGNGNKIGRSDNYNNDRLMILTNNAAGNITLENVIIDGGSTTNKKPIVETSGGSTLNLDGVTFQNCATSSNQGVICVKTNGKLNLNNVVIKDSELPAGAGDVFAGSNTVKVAGNCTLSIFLQNDNYFTATDLTDGLVTILFDTAGTRDLATKPFVIGNDNTALFKSGDPNYDLKVAEGNIMLEKNELSSVVEGISNDEAQIVDVYSIQGVRLKSGVAAAEATEGLPAGLYIVGGKKVIVR